MKFPSVDDMRKAWSALDEAAADFTPVCCMHPRLIEELGGREVVDQWAREMGVTIQEAPTLPSRGGK